MANEVYANMMEVACKAAAGKVICAFPDVCFTPPTTPATPPGVPIPYPNTGMASDCTSGSTTVKISGQEVMLKNKSYFKRSTGDEAGAAPKKGLISSKNMGAVYFKVWSMDVKIEGENVVRHFDLTTNNHACEPGNESIPWPYIDAMAAAADKDHPCHTNVTNEQSKCQQYTPYNKSPDAKDPCDTLSILDKPTNDRAKADQLSDEVALNDCLSARRCRLVEGEDGKGDAKCCPGQTGHHLVEAASLAENRPAARVPMLDTFPNSPEAYNPSNAPCVCAEGTGNAVGGTHELMHALQKAEAMKVPVDTAGLGLAGGGNTGACRVWTYKEAKTSGMKALKTVFQMSGCDEKCIEAQLDAYHEKCGITDETKIKAVPAGPDPKKKNAAQAIEEARQRNRKVLEQRLASHNLISGAVAG